MNSYYLKNREYIIERQKTYYQKNKEKICDYYKKYYEKNKIEINNYRRYGSKIIILPPKKPVGNIIVSF
jgi:hypothetical protein